MPKIVSKLKSRIKSVLQPLSANKKELLNIRIANLKSRENAGLKRARFAIIGCGRQGSHLAKAIENTPKLQLTSALDKNVDALDNIKNIHPEVLTHTDGTEFFKTLKTCDALIIATTADSHFTLAKTAIEHGCKSIFLEKPVTNCLADAFELSALAKKCGVRICVNHTRRFLPSYIGLKHLLSRSIVGKPKAIHLLIGRGGLAMVGSHFFDIISFLFDSEFANISSELNSKLDPTIREGSFEDPCGSCSGQLQNGIRFFMDLSADLVEKQMFFVIHAEHGRIEVDERAGYLRVVSSFGFTHETEFLYPGALPLGFTNGLTRLVTGKQICTVEDGAEALAAVIGCHLSSERNQKIKFPLPSEWQTKRFNFA